MLGRICILWNKQFKCKACRKQMISVVEVLWKFHFIQYIEISEDKVSFSSTYLGWEGISVYWMFGSELIVETVVDMYFLELVFIRKWPSGHIYVMVGVVIYCKYYTMACIADWSADLEGRIQLQ